MSLPGGVRLRRAVPEDAEAGAALHAACWREAYGPYVDPALLEAALDDPAGWAQRWREQLAGGPPRILAETGSDGAARELVGFACVGSVRDDAAAEVELYAIYLRAAWWGSGLADALLDAVLPGSPSCSLWVLSANLRAQGFYRRRGFRPDGASEHYARLAADELRMVRPGLLRTVGDGE